MKLQNIEPLGLPVAFTDGILLQLFIFMTATCILAARLSGAREVNLQLPEVDAKAVEEQRSAAPGDAAAIQICILRAGTLTVDAKPVPAVKDLPRFMLPGRPVVIALEKGAAADLLIGVEVELKKLGVREVTVLLKGV